MIFELGGSRLRVMGTLHLLPPGKVLPAWVRSGYDWSEAVFVEHSPTEFLALAQHQDAIPEGDASAALWSLLRQVAGQPPIPLDRLHRGAAVVMALASRLSGVAGADQALHGWCLQDAKPFGYVEQAAQALAALDEVTEADWIAGIAAEQARLQSPAQQLQHFYDWWRKGKLDEIARASLEGLFSCERIRHKMLIERNAAWAARYAEPDRRSLVAVGAAHLVGPGNFLEQLARVSGRRVRRVV